MNVRLAEPCRASHLTLSDAEKLIGSILNPPHVAGKADPAPCHQDIFLSFFFDGTNNNKYRDTPNQAQSNVARLLEACIGGPRKSNSGDQMHKKSLFLALAACAIALSACKPIGSVSSEKNKKEDPNTFTASTYSLNYSSKYFFDYTVYDATVPTLPAIGGASVTPLGGGDQGCCIALPKVWRPGLKVLIKWSNSDRDKTFDEYSREFEIPRYTEPGNLFVTFYDANDVELVVSRYEAGHPQWPGRIKADPMSHCLETEPNKKQCEQWSARNMTRMQPSELLDGCDFQRPNEACQVLIPSCVAEFGKEACSEESIKAEAHK